MKRKRNGIIVKNKVCDGREGKRIENGRQNEEKKQCLYAKKERECELERRTNRLNKGQ